MDYGEEWTPLFAEDFSFDFEINPISYMRQMVFNKNESWDSRILGFRGGGKSTVALSLSLLFNPKLLDMSPKKALERCWCFSTEDRLEKKKNLHRGDILITDEQGTKVSGSSYQYRTDENQELADSRQIDRVDGVMEIGVTLDEMRVIKRVRNIARVDIFPETKLSSTENKNMGMGIDCIFRELKENPFATNDKDKIKPRYFKYDIGGRISRVTIPLPPIDYWNEYTIIRRKFKDELENKYQEEQDIIVFNRDVKATKLDERRNNRNKKREYF